MVSNHVPAADTDFVPFINEFLFNPPPQESSARSIPRHLRTLPRHKRYRTMWRAAAATSLMKKRYSSQETQLPFAEHLLTEPPSHVSIDNGNSSKETHLPVAYHLLRELPSSDNGHSSHITRLPSAQPLHRNPPSQFSLNTADESLRQLPLEVSLDEGHASQATQSSSADQFLKKLLSQVFLDDGTANDSLSTDQLLRYLPSQCSLDYGGGLATSDSQQYNHNRIDVAALKEAPFITPACSKSAIKGSPSGCCSKTQPLEATSNPAIPKHSSRKPPRPPRGSVPRSGSYRAIRLKNAARRATVENARMRKQKLPKSTSNATSIWALIITLCFATIMLVQGFLGNNYTNLDSRAEGQPLGEGVSLLSPYVGVPPFASESSTWSSVAEHKALDQLQQKKRRDSPFTNLRRHRLRRLEQHL